MTTTIRKPKANTIMIEKNAGTKEIVRRYAPSSKAATYAAQGWAVWVPCCGGWKRA
jgi:hypothetical protein